MWARVHDDWLCSVWASSWQPCCVVIVVLKERRVVASLCRHKWLLEHSHASFEYTRALLHLYTNFFSFFGALCRGHVPAGNVFNLSLRDCII